MIFITVGSQLPFDRLISKLDEYYQSSDDVFAQVGQLKIEPKNISYTEFLKPNEVNELYKKSSLVIAHAGMGSILTALKYKKPIIIVPRKASLGETRNEHQTATANWVKSLPGVFVANDEYELIDFLEKKSGLLFEGETSLDAEDRLIKSIRQFIDE